MILTKQKVGYYKDREFGRLIDTVDNMRRLRATDEWVPMVPSELAHFTLYRGIPDSVGMSIELMMTILRSVNVDQL